MCDSISSVDNAGEGVIRVLREFRLRARGTGSGTSVALIAAGERSDVAQGIGEAGDATQGVVLGVASVAKRVRQRREPSENVELPPRGIAGSFLYRDGVGTGVVAPAPSMPLPSY